MPLVAKKPQQIFVLQVIVASRCPTIPIDTQRSIVHSKVHKPLVYELLCTKDAPDSPSPH